MLDDEMVASMDLSADSAEDVKEVKDGSESRSAEASTEVRLLTSSGTIAPVERETENPPAS